MQGKQEGFFFSEHGGDLSFGRAVDARVGPALFPTIQIGLCFSQALETHSLERGFLRMPDARFDFSFSIGVLDPARQCGYAIVREHILKQRVDGGIVDVGNQHAFLQIVEDDDSDAPTARFQLALHAIA